jgi:hypothetical protein
MSDVDGMVHKGPSLDYVSKKTGWLDFENGIFFSDIQYCIFGKIIAESFYNVNHGSSIITSKVRQIILVMKT